MSRSRGPAGRDEAGFGPCGCDPEKVFEYADGGNGPEGLDPERERKMREHLASCQGCRELYERELDLNAFLSSLDFSVMHLRPVSRSVAMALPTRAMGPRILWGLLAGALLVGAFISLEFNGTEPVILLMSILGTCWGLVMSSAKVAHAVFTAAGPTILLVLALGALADLLIAFVVLFASRDRRPREA
jgi:hypothetical protein